MTHRKGKYCEVALSECHEACGKTGTFMVDAQLAMQIIQLCTRPVTGWHIHWRAQSDIPLCTLCVNEPASSVLLLQLRFFS